MANRITRTVVVMILIITLPVLANGATIFSDNFDSCTVGCNWGSDPPNSPSAGEWAGWLTKDSAEYITIDGVTHTAGEISSPGRGGAGKSLKIWRNGGYWAGNGAYVGVLYPSQWTPQRHVFMRFWMKIPVKFDAYNAYNMKFFRFITNGDPDVVYVQINASSGWTRDTAEFQISDNFIHPWQKDWPWVTLLTNSEVKTKMWDGNWHSHEFELDLDNNIFRYWVDDNLQYQNTNWVWNLKGGITWINHFNLGNQIEGAYFQTGWQAMELDDLVISTTRVGLGAGGAEPPPFGKQPNPPAKLQLR